MIISATGHRQNHPKMGGWVIPNQVYKNICQQTEEILKELSPEKCISGMSQGFDFWFAYVSVKLGIPFTAAIPFVGQENIWPEKAQRQYKWLLSKAKDIVIVSDGGYAAYKMQVRNKWMVNNSDLILACFDHSSKSGGTYNCIQYAKSVNKEIRYLEI